MKSTLLFLLIATTGLVYANPSFAMEEEIRVEEGQVEKGIKKYAVLPKNALCMKIDDHKRHWVIEGDVHVSNMVALQRKFGASKMRGRGRGAKAISAPLPTDIHVLEINDSDKIEWQKIQSFSYPAFYPEDSSREPYTWNAYPWKYICNEKAPFCRVVETYVAHVSVEGKEAYPMNDYDSDLRYDYYFFKRANLHLISKTLEYLDAPYVPQQVSVRASNPYVVKEAFDISDGRRESIPEEFMHPNFEAQ